MGKILTSMVLAGFTALGLGGCKEETYAPAPQCESNERYQIQIEDPQYSIKIRLEGNLARRYQKNPQRVEYIIRNNVLMMIGDVQVGESLDALFDMMNRELAKKKIKILEMRSAIQNPPKQIEL
ncbi:hypothetical protein GOV03_02250 [Candidatus Woesearchaeota archaeon]|nr:hypothetical protein [Candidatus Woesearchaeota archaeon]